MIVEAPHQPTSPVSEEIHATVSRCTRGALGEDVCEIFISEEKKRKADQTYQWDLSEEMCSQVNLVQ
jgi:hypothetical protein